MVHISDSINGCGNVGELRGEQGVRHNNPQQTYNILKSTLKCEWKQTKRGCEQIREVLTKYTYNYKYQQTNILTFQGN